MTLQRLRFGRPWADLVLHVLGPRSGPRSFPFRPLGAWLREIRRPRGRACRGARSGRGRVPCLARAIDSHQALARLHLLACLFDTPQQARRCIATDLADLPASDVAAPGLIGAVAACGPAAEVLRTAALLEEEVWRALPDEEFDASQLESELAAVGQLAPLLRSFELFLSRPLGFRGRVFGSEIWVGVPGSIDGLGARHVAWQAGHEATVAEVARHADQLLDERTIEHGGVDSSSVSAQPQGSVQRPTAHGSRSWPGSRSCPAMPWEAMLDGYSILWLRIWAERTGFSLPREPQAAEGLAREGS